MIETRYQVNDVVYAVAQHKGLPAIGKGIVRSIRITKEAKTTDVTYNIFLCKDKKVVPFHESCLVPDLETARKSALTNLDQLYAIVKKALKNANEDSFKNDSE